jgi:hypothetical protein
MRPTAMAQPVASEPPLPAVNGTGGEAPARTPSKALVTITGDGQVAANGLDNVPAILAMIGHLCRFAGELAGLLDVKPPQEPPAT